MDIGRDLYPAKDSFKKGCIYYRPTGPHHRVTEYALSMSLSINFLWNSNVKPTIHQLETEVFDQFACGNTQIKVSYG